MYSSSIGAPPSSNRQRVGGMMVGNSDKSAVTNDDLSSGGGDGANIDFSALYPRGLVIVLSALKAVAACCLVSAGVVAFYQRASYAANAAGVWGGLVAAISAVLGAFSVRHNAARGYVLAFFASSVCAVMADVLIVIYSSTGLAKDSGYPGGFVRGADGDIVPASQVQSPARENAMFVNLALIILGVLEILLSLPSIVLCLRHVCGCYPPTDLLLLSRRHAHQHAHGPTSRGDWLMSWLGQQTHQVYYSSASGIPYAKVPAYTPAPPPPPFVYLPPSPESMAAPPQYSPTYHYPSPPESSRRSSRRHRPPTARSSSRYFTPLDVAYAPQQFYYHAPPYPSPGSNFSPPHLIPISATSPASAYLPNHQQPWMLYGDDLYLHQRAAYPTRPPRGVSSSSSGRRKRARSKSQGRGQMSSSSSSKRNKTNGPSDSDLDKTYTGLDRELAEEFIEQTMDPAIVLSSRSLNSSNKNNNKAPYRPGRNASAATGQSSSAMQSPTSQQTASGTEIESEAW